jgi:2-keto-4-pentenoate hydratase/2-oxohepta-3-ene-1,7-dioic acid hydratase in catechol pathway
VKLLTFLPPRVRNGRFGALLSTGQIVRVPWGGGLPMSLLQCVRGGDAALDAVREYVEVAERDIKAGRQGPEMYEPSAVKLLPPLRPGKIMAVGRNYGDHVAEAGGHASPRPAGFIKLVNCLIGHEAPIVRPPWTETLDYENELAIVIGRDCVDVPPERVYDYVFGYTIMNDVSAREVQREEQATGTIIMGKNFPTSAPLGPWVVTRDEIPDAHNLRLITRVNGEVRQNANTGDMIHKIPAQIAWYSHAGLQAGDVISTGTPAGVALGYKGPGSWYLKAGDVVEAEVQGIGVLRNPVRDRKASSF